ncbi:MAG: winged helix-turn-helix transcriptional regulator [Bacilli bacterium]|nr:winged helix-turn-helix transcriptional regulator [Bacilli bacterium]
MDNIDLKNIIWTYIRNITDNINLAVAPICDKYGLTLLQTRILMALLKLGKCTIGTLADEVSMAGTNISTMCKKLDKKGLLVRKREIRDERVVRVALTDKGKEIALAINQEIDAKIRVILQGESVDAVEVIIRGLMKLDDLLIKMREI